MVLTSEVEPCIQNRGSVHIRQGVAQRKSEFVQRCIAVILLHVIFLFAIAVALIIGHWKSEETQRYNQTELNQTSSEIHRRQYQSRKTTVTPESLHFHTQLLTTSTRTLSSKSSIYARVSERLIPLEKKRNFTLSDVFPPSEYYTGFENQVHDAPAEKLTTDAILIPLPLYILPYHYNLQLDFSSFDTSLIVRGNVSIFLESFGNSTEDEIQFHFGPNMKIEQMRLRYNGTKVFAKTFQTEDSKKMGRLLLREPLNKGNYLLEIEYNMTICDASMDGFRCSFETSNNGTLKATSFTTKFEPTLARSFLPCWDDPGFKATFNITVKHDKKYVVLSNMPILPYKDLTTQEKESDKGLITTAFETTPPMSTYLLALAIGEFVKLETRTLRSTPVTFWTYAEDVMSLNFALGYAPSAIDKFEDELEIAFPLPKLDLVAARNFHVGGMENWGLIFFDFNSVAYSPQITNYVNETVDRMYHEFRIGQLVFHEIAHQWFGNLVTMRDWSELFLNEGFATFYVYELASIERPLTTQFVYYDNLATLFSIQSGEYHHLSMVRDLVTESQIDSSFHPSNLYTKGCVLIKMIKDLVNDFDFKTAVRRYLRRNSYRSVSREDLFSSLPAYAEHGAEHEKLNHVLEGWFVNQGLPEITLTRNYDNEMMTIKQKKTIQNEHNIFLYDRKISKRALMSLEDGSTPFDDALFDGYAKRNKDLRRKSKYQEKIILNRTVVNTRRQQKELRKSRRVGTSHDLWTIPITYMFGSLKTNEGQVSREFWLKNKSVTFGDAEISPNQAILVNPQWKYPFRVNYDLLNWKLIARILHQNHREIDEKSRMQLILDAEYFLAKSSNPHLYLYLLGYLAHETKLEVMLFGVDAVYRFIDVFEATQLKTAILLYFEPVINQMDRLLNESQLNSETASLWLVKPERMSKLYQMRCAAGISTCRKEFYTKKWTREPDHWTEDIHKQGTAVCHQLSSGSRSELRKVEDLLESRVNSFGAKWSLTVQLSVCSHDEKLLRRVARAVVSTKNAAVYASALKSEFSIHYNSVFRKYLWAEISKLSIFEKTSLFSTNNTSVLKASKILLHSVKTIDELHQVRSLVSDWGPLLSHHFEYLEKYLLWISNVSQGVLHQFFAADLSLS